MTGVKRKRSAKETAPLTDRLSRPDVYTQGQARDAAADPPIEVVPHMRYTNQATPPSPIAFTTVEREDATRLGSPAAATASYVYIYYRGEVPPPLIVQKCHTIVATAIVIQSKAPAETDGSGTRCRASRAPEPIGCQARGTPARAAGVTRDWGTARQTHMNALRILARLLPQ